MGLDVTVRLRSLEREEKSLSIYILYIGCVLYGEHQEMARAESDGDYCILYKNDFIK